MSYLEEIEGSAAEFRRSPIEAIPFSLYRLFDETGDRLRYEDAYFSRRRRLTALGLASWLWRRREDIAALEDALWAVCEEFSWALPAHLGGRSLEAGAIGEHETALDLFACETAFALAEIRNLLRDELAPAVAERTRAEVLRRVLLPFMAKELPWGWELMKNNWCAVCGGSVGAAALYLYDDGPELDAILERLYPTLDRFLESFADDGACLEGLGYWTYGVGFFVSFADLLARRTAGRVDLLAAPKFRRIAAFQAAAYLSGSLAVSFADGDPQERYRRGLSAYLSRRFPEAALPPEALAAGFSEDRCGRWCLAFRDLLWTEEGGSSGGGASGIAPVLPERKDRSSPGRKTERGPVWFPDAQWLIHPAAREDGFAFAAKGGDNDEPHNHNDVGSFVLARGGELLLTDLGAGEYVKDYFNEKRYSIFCTSSFGHSVPIIDARGQAAGSERRARNVEFRREGERSVLTMDIAAAYDSPSLRKFTRRFEFVASEGLVLMDELESETPPEVVERFVTGCRVIPTETGAIIAGGEYSVFVAAEGTPRIEEHLHRDHAGREVTVRTLDFRYRCGPRSDAAEADRAGDRTGAAGPHRLRSFRFVFRGRV